MGDLSDLGLHLDCVSGYWFLWAQSRGWKDEDLPPGSVECSL